MPGKKNSNRFRQSNDAVAPPKLLAAAHDSRLVIFAGAGISMAAPTNLPSWRDVNRIVVRSLAASAASAVGEPLAAKAADLILARHEQKKLPPEYQAQVLAEFLHDRYFEVLPTRGRLLVRLRRHRRVRKNNSELGSPATATRLRVGMGGVEQPPS